MGGAIAERVSRLRTICVVTGSRAEYGLLQSLIKEINEDSELQLQIVVTGMHLSPEFGLTYKEIIKDGYSISAKVEMLLSSDTSVGIAKSMGLGLVGFADVWERLNPDIIVLLGDRFEMMVAAQSAMIFNIPIAHLHGGESTEGLIDEAIRHSITKMSHLHFVSTDKYRQRVIQLGEQPERVFQVGAIGLDNIRNLTLLSKAEFEQSISFQLSNPTFLVTYHPLTLQHKNSVELTQQLLDACQLFKDASIIFTMPNADTDGRIIAQMIDQYVREHPDRAVSFVSLGQLRYLSALQYVDVVIGNSSSGLIEVPLFRKPTINIGPRQEGRVKGSTVIDCGETTEEIVQAIQKVLSASFYETNLRNAVSEYGDGQTAPRIKKILKEFDLSNIIQKKFYEVGIE